MKRTFLISVLLLLLVFWEAMPVSAANKVIPLGSGGISELIQNEENVMVLVAMAAWCSPCRQELPILMKIQDRYRDRGLKLIGISLDVGGPGAIQPIVDHFDVNFPVYWGGEQVVKECKISAIPLLILTKGGKEIERIVGKRSEEFLDQKIAALIE